MAGNAPFRAVPRSSIEAEATHPVVDESSLLTQIFIEILTWYFSNKGKHRDLLLQSPLADGFAIDPDKSSTKQNLITVQAAATYQVRNNPSITVMVGPPRSIRSGLGISVEHSRRSRELGKLLKRSYSNVDITLHLETSSEQVTNRLAKLITEIFFQHIPEYYNSVIILNDSQSQVIFPQTFSQSNLLIKDFQPGSNVERIYSHKFSFTVDFESLRWIDAFPQLHVTNLPAKMQLEHDIPATLKMGQQYTATIKTNLLGVKLFVDKPAYIELQQISGPFGTEDGTRYYKLTPLRTGEVIFTLADMKESQQVRTSHRITF